MDHELGAGTVVAASRDGDGDGDTEQDAIEARYREWEVGRGAESQVPGAPEEWEFSLGTFRLFLIAPLGRWFAHDALHDEWRDTGVGAGEGRFAAVGTRLYRRE